MDFPKVEIIGVKGLPIIKEGDDLASLIIEAVERMGLNLRNGDILVISHIIVSKSEGRVRRLEEYRPSRFAEEIAKRSGKDPRHVEAILQSSRRIVRMRDGLIICEAVGGHICANAGVDLSNAGIGRVALLPEDPDLSASRIRERIKKLIGVEVAVIISDTQGRPLRRGSINIAIGCSGLKPILDRRGERDLYGRTLRSKMICIADELASAAELVIGQADEGVPVAIIRGYEFERSEEPASMIPRSEQDDLFL
ncbi:MAG: coenzyme F420-0:L-glutamate ligase [Thaumarchaeota archaeon]|nr:MAG: coenzyme F420-0:L-glutamate ligase [Nitrososphaerota archaeon]